VGRANRIFKLSEELGILILFNEDSLLAYKERKLLNKVLGDKAFKFSYGGTVQIISRM
jgi:hypothetical protein